MQDMAGLQVNGAASSRVWASHALLVQLCLVKDCLYVQTYSAQVTILKPFCFSSRVSRLRPRPVTMV